MPVTTKLIIGGVDKIPDFISMDLGIGADIVADVRLRWPIPDGAIDVAFSSHMIEHLTREEALYAMAECHRVLRPGGIVRLSTPDLALFARKYVERDMDFYGQIDVAGRTRFPGESISDRFMFVCHGMGHKWIYDSESLCLLLREVGFTGVESKGFRDSFIPHVELLDNRPDISLFVEGMKGPLSDGDASDRAYSRFALPRKSTVLIRSRFWVHVLKSRLGKSLRQLRAKVEAGE